MGKDIKNDSEKEINQLGKNYFKEKIKQSGKNYFVEAIKQLEKNDLEKIIKQLEKEVKTIDNNIHVAKLVSSVSGPATLSAGFVALTNHIGNFLPDAFSLVSMGIFTLGAVEFFLANNFITDQEGNLSRKQNEIEDFSKKLNDKNEEIAEIEKEEEDDYFRRVREYFNFVGPENDVEEKTEGTAEEKPENTVDGKTENKRNSEYAFGVTEEELNDAKANGTHIIRVIHGNRPEDSQDNQTQDNSDSQGLNE